MREVTQFIEAIKKFAGLEKKVLIYVQQIMQQKSYIHVEKCRKTTKRSFIDLNY